MRKHIILLSFFILIFSVIASAEQPIAYGPTTDNDQLWQIAISLRPNPSIKVEQMMLAILKTNPKAFTNNNAYQLKPGYVLAIPTMDVIKKISADNAVKEIQKQHDTFLGITEKTNIPLLEPKPHKELKGNKENNEPKNQIIIEELKEKIIDASKQYQENITSVTQQNQNLQTKIEQLNTNVENLKQEIKKIHEEQNKHPKILGFLYSYSQWAHNFLNTTGLKLIAALALLLIVWWSFLHYKQSKLEERTNKLNYDFMNGEEGMNVKLDLAQAYIDMNDKESARKVLTEVKEFGNPKQKIKAQELLKKL